MQTGKQINYRCSTVQIMNSRTEGKAPLNLGLSDNPPRFAVLNLPAAQWLIKGQGDKTQMEKASQENDNSLLYRKTAK